MAWTETCKIDANKQVEHLAKQGMTKEGAIKKLSAESGIPYGTIQRWVYSRNKGKNDPTPTTTQNDSEKGAGQGNDDTGQEWPTCSQCKSKSVEKNYRNNKPNNNGLCRSCRRFKAAEKKSQKAKEKFEQIEIDQESDVYWRKKVEELSSLFEGYYQIPIGKVSKETLDLVLDAKSHFYFIFKTLIESSECKHQDIK